MFFTCYLRDDLVYIPTSAKFDIGISTHIEPIDVVPVSDAHRLRQAFERVCRTVILVLPTPARDKYPPSDLPKYAGVKTWGAFARGTKIWDAGVGKDGWQIDGYRDGPRSSFLVDKDQRIKFPPGTTVDDVIDRLIVILQESAGVVPPKSASG